MNFRFQIGKPGRCFASVAADLRWIAVLCAVCFCGSLRAADVSVKASLSEATTEVGQPVQFQITITGARNAKPPERIAVSGLDINYSGQSTQVQVLNFNMTMSVVHSYNVLPQRAGSFTISAQEVEIDGARLKTNPVTLNVGSSATAGGDANSRIAFAELVLPKQTAYVGEAIPVELRVYVDTRIRWQTNDQPTISGEGFTLQKLTPPAQNQTHRDGRDYDLVTFKTAITPVKTGKLSLGPAELNCLAQLPRQKRPRGLGDLFDNDVFNDPFGAFAQTQRMTVKSDAVEIQVKPLPAAGQPRDFSGAVGQFTLATQASPKKVRVGDPITMTLRVSGRGNFDRVGAPQLVEETGWRSYPPSGKFQADDDVGISGSKTFEMAVIPEEKKSALPAIDFSYFDPISEKYVTLHSDRGPINVEGTGAPIAQTTPEPAPAQASATSAPTPNPDDIHYIRTDAGRWGVTFEPIYRKRAFWIAQFAPLLALIGFAGFQVHRARKSDIRAQQLAEWRREQGSLMKKLSREDISDDEFLDAATKYFQLGTARRTGRNPSSISASDVVEMPGLDPAAVQNVQAIFAVQAERRYAGTGRGSGRISSETRAKYLETIREFDHATI